MVSRETIPPRYKHFVRYRRIYNLKKMQYRYTIFYWTLLQSHGANLEKQYMYALNAWTSRCIFLWQLQSLVSCRYSIGNRATLHSVVITYMLSAIHVGRPSSHFRCTIPRLSVVYESFGRCTIFAAYCWWRDEVGKITSPSDKDWISLSRTARWRHWWCHECVTHNLHI